VRNNPLNWIDPSGFTEEEPEGHWYSGFTNLFSSAPVAAVDMSGSLGSQVAAALAAMDFPNGNDAPNSSGCPNGTGSAPLPCAMPGAAGCSPGAGSSPQGTFDTYYTQSQLTVLSFAGALMRWPSFGTALDFAYAEANSRPDAGVEPVELPIAGPPGVSDAEWEGGMLADSAMRTMTGMAADVMISAVVGQGVLSGLPARRAGAQRPTFLNRGDPGRGHVKGVVIHSEGKFTLSSAEGREVVKGEFDFVVQGGVIRVGKGHYVLAGGGQPVEYAGSIKFGDGGSLVEWTNASGHYRPSAAFARNAGLPMESFRPVPFPAMVGAPQIPVYRNP
jgi:hypothetical protein